MILNFKSNSQFSFNTNTASFSQNQDLYCEMKFLQDSNSSQKNTSLLFKGTAILHHHQQST